MLKWLATMAASLAFGYGLGSLVHEAGTADVTAAAPAGSNLSTSASPVGERLLALERALAEERQVRQVLQDELVALTAAIEALGPPPAAYASASAASVTSAAGSAPPDARAEPPASGTGDRIARLVESGFPPGQAQWIVERESQLQMEALQARYDAERSGDTAAWFERRDEAAAALRAELGDEEYARYREAVGRSTAITVGAVIDGSPAERAGFEPGDRILRYGGRRVFAMTDLTREILSGSPGEPVVVDVVRGGLPQQFTLPRGPLGVQGGGRFGD